MNGIQTVIGTAFSQYANRPADERFPSLDALIAASEAERRASAEKTYAIKDLRAVVDGSSVALESPRGVAHLSHWAFGQFARTVGAPAGYLRELPAELAAANVNHGISVTQADVNLLVKAPNGNPVPVIRAATSQTYGRVWDHELYTAARDQIFAHDTKNGQWVLPPTWNGEPAGAYRGDRDSFLIQVDGGSIVDNPSNAKENRGTDGRPMFRGVMIGNSEVGNGSVWIDCVLFDFVCGNHNLWGAVIDKRFRRRHVGSKVLRDTIRQIATIAREWTNHSAERDAAIVKSLCDNEIAATKEALIAELRELGATKEQAEQAYDRCEQTESVSPRSFWGIASGLTRVSQDSGFQDERLSLDQLASKIMAIGARKLVAA